ncbi:leucine-rich repeat domain protein, partial [Escherichia coli TW09195]
MYYYGAVMKFPSIFNKIKPQSIQQHPEKNQLN